METLLVTSIQRTVCRALEVAQYNVLAQEDRETSQSDVEMQIRHESIYMARGYISLQKHAFTLHYLLHETGPKSYYRRVLAEIEMEIAHITIPQGAKL